MAKRAQLAPVLALALVLVILVVGLAGIFTWGGFGTEEGLSENPKTQSGGGTDQAGSLKGETGAAGQRVAETQRENIQPAPNVGGAAKVELAGRLVRSDRTPGAGLILRYLQLDSGGLLRGRPVPGFRDAPAIQTDADGRFRVQANADTMGFLRLDSTEVVFKEGTGRGMAVTMGKGPKDLGDVPILMSARVSGQVVDATGQPVAGVSVTAGGDVSSAWTLTLGDGNHTDKDGRFDLAGLRPGKKQLLTRSPEHLPAEHEVELSEGEHRQDILIQVQPGGFILGTVVDDLGQPVPGAEVAASRTRRVDTQIKITAFSPGESTRTDDTGRFRLANLSTQKATLRVTKPGLATRTLPDVSVGRTDLVLELQRLGAIEGVLVDVKNRPVQGSTVSASAGGEMLPLDIRRSATVTGAAGGFRLENVQPGQVLVTARGEDHLPARERVRVRPGETTRGVRLVAAPGTILEVTVQDPTGQPVANADVTVRERDNGGPIRMPATGGRRMEYRAVARRDRDGAPVFLGRGNALGQGKTDAHGKVTIGGLPGGAVVIGARHRVLALVQPQEMVLPDAGKASTVLQMRRGGFLLVTIVDAAGKPVPDARFEVARVVGDIGEDEEPAESREESCDGDGKSRVGPLPAGDYTAVLLGELRPRLRGGMSITMAGMEPRLLDSQVRLQVREGGTTEVVLRKPILTTVRGTVRDRSGPVQRAQVTLTREGEFRVPLANSLEAYTDEEGRFEILGAPSGNYTLSWGRRSAIVPSEEDIQLQKDQPELVRHLVIPGAVLKLRALDVENEEAVEGAEVSLQRVRASSPGQEQQPRRRTQIRMISITSRGSGPQRLDMSAGDRSARTDEDGVVVIKDVPPGIYSLRIRHRLMATHREEVQVLGDAILDLGTKKLTSGGSVSGSILFEDTDELKMALVQLTTSDGKDSERTVSANGRFRFSGLATGKYRVRAQRVGKPDARWGPEATVEVKPGQTARARLRLPPR